MRAAKSTDIQGVFVVRDRRAVFVPVTTGIIGVTDIEVSERLYTKAIKLSPEVIKILRTLKPDAR